jgi:hypothetical protein
MSTQVRTSNQSRASTKIVIGFILLVGLGYLGKSLYENRVLSTKSYAPVSPARLNLVGVDTKKGGYHIVVANGIAQLIQSSNQQFGAGDENPDQDTGGNDSGDKKRMPLKEMLETMQGKGESVGRFVAVLNDMKDEDLPATRVYWTKADIVKALQGDAALRAKLERDMNTSLDGKPLAEFRPSTFETGIVIKLPVTINVTTPQGKKPVTGDLLYPFQTTLMKALYQRVKEVPNLTSTTLAGYYAEVAKIALANPGRLQNVSEALNQIISEQNVAGLTQLPQDVLDSISVIANDSMIESASYTPEDTTRGTVYNMDIKLTEEGRNRLWQYSRNNVGTQLLLVTDGIAIAAPKVGDELAQTNLTIERLPDETLVKQAVDIINSSKGRK